MFVRVHLCFLLESGGKRRVKLLSVERSLEENEKGRQISPGRKKTFLSFFLGGPETEKERQEGVGGGGGFGGGLQSVSRLRGN